MTALTWQVAAIIAPVVIWDVMCAPQEAAVEAWKEACSMRRCGREPSRLDLAAHFASAASEKADAEPLVGKVRALGSSRKSEKL